MLIRLNLMYRLIPIKGQPAITCGIVVLDILKNLLLCGIVYFNFTIQKQDMKPNLTREAVRTTDMIFIFV